MRWDDCDTAAMPRGARQAQPDETSGSRRIAADGGFTLFELVIVIIIIAIISAIALPQFLPMIAWSKVEGSARHISDFGRAAMAHSAMMNERVLVRFDLDAQEYWAVHWALSQEAQDRIAKKKEEKAKDGGKSVKLRSMEIGKTHTAEEDQESEEDKEMQADFDKMLKKNLESASNNVKKEGMMDQVQIKFSKFSLDSEKMEEEEEEEQVLDSPMLLRTAMPIEEARITSIRVGDAESSSGTVEIDMSPGGNFEPVAFSIEGSRDSYTVIWDPITATTQIIEGKNAV